MKGAAIVLFAALAAGSQLQSQGVPTQDTSGITQLSKLLFRLGEGREVQDAQREAATSLAAVEAEQLRTLEAMSAALAGPGLDIRTLEEDANAPAGAVYPAIDPHPMDSRLFGEGRETVEMMIVRVAGEYADTPGVRRAGLSATQWRCLYQALIKQESRFSVTAESPVGAYGLTQLMPGTASDMGIDRYDVMDNLRGGARYITTQLETFGTIPHALAAYNAGPGRVMEYGGVPPFAETQGYVRNISRYYNEYLAVVGGADALGTLSLEDMALAEYSAISHASLHYAADSHVVTVQVISRLAAIIRGIDETPDARRAFELNTYARAELGRILAARLRLMAAERRREAAHGQHLVADRLAERDFMRMEVVR